MARTFAKATIQGNGLTVTLNEEMANGRDFMVWKNVKESLSSMSTRRSDAPKQASHGSEAGLSHYNSRLVPFEGTIHATSLANRVALEQNLRSCLTLKQSQSYAGDDGYRLVVITDEDGNEKQIYLKLVDIDFDRLIEGNSLHSRFRFTMVAEEDVFLSSTTLESEAGTESVLSTDFQIQDGGLPTFQDGDLPTIQDSFISLLTVTNDGTIDVAPIITLYGPMVDPIITNTTNGQTMDLSQGGGLTILEDERVVIDVAALTITHYDVSDVQTDVSGNLTPDSDWIYLDSGNNYVSLFDDSPGVLLGTMEFEYRKQWI